MHNHTVGRTASVISPFYSLLPGSLALEYNNPGIILFFCKGMYTVHSVYVISSDPSYYDGNARFTTVT